MKRTCFHTRLAAQNQTEIWKNWAGYLVAPSYQHSISAEYYAVRNGVSVFDTSPLFKYRIVGSDALQLLQLALARDAAATKIGQAQYNVLCDKRGFVLQDGVLLRLGEDEFYFTAAEPILRYLQQLGSELALNSVTIEDVSTQFGILAIQGPLSFEVLQRLTPDVEGMRYFRVRRTEIGGLPVIISRTGFTGDLGYEIWIPADAATSIWDLIWDSGEGRGITPIGTTALKMVRVEAGLLLLGVDFDSALYSWVDEQRDSPVELGFGWMFKNLGGDSREFLGRERITHDLRTSGRWQIVGLEVDWHEFERVHRDAGVRPEKYNAYFEGTMSVYRRGTREWDYAGYASSFMYSPVLKRSIAIAKLATDCIQPGTEVDLEVTVIRKPVNVKAIVTPVPFFNPSRKTAAVRTTE